jgi:hypothetical protein
MDIRTFLNIAIQLCDILGKLHLNLRHIEELVVLNDEAYHIHEW